MKRRHEQKFVIMSLVLLFLLNMPLLLLFDFSSSFFGIPVIYVYVFSIWFLASVLSWIILKKYVE
jgi:hypothetical protein